MNRNSERYHYSQLFSHFVDPTDILHQFRTTNNLTDFYNLKIGIAYVEATNRLSVQEVLSLCGNAGIADSDPGPCYMGVDQGKDLHVIIGKKHAQKGANRSRKGMTLIDSIGRGFFLGSQIFVKAGGIFFDNFQLNIPISHIKINSYL